MKQLNMVKAVVYVLLCNLAIAGNLVVNPSFEFSEDTDGGWPSSYGDWNGDYSSIVTTSSGITPLEGSRMLSMRGTAHTTIPSSANTCQVYQIIDIGSHTDIVSSGNAIATVEAFFNRVSGDAQTDTRMVLNMRAFIGTPASFPHIQEAGISPLASSSLELFSDADTTTWEKLQLFFQIPAATDFLVIGVNASENIYNDSSGIEFDGHFADAISLEIIPEPATLLFLGLGGLVLLKRKS